MVPHTPRLFLCLLALLALAAARPVRAELGAASCPQLTDALEELELPVDDKLVLTADRLMLEKQGLSRLLGSVRLRQGGREFRAESLDYDDANKQVHIRVDSVFRNRQFLIRSKQSHFDLVEETGSFDDTEFTLTQRSARGSSSRITLARTGTARFEDMRYTTCAPGSRAWYLEAGSVKLDHEAGLGTARNARLRFMGVPILYAPWFQFPIDDRRRSGLLFPTVGESDNTGFDFRQPIYLNLAPNYDATVTPRYMSSRGLQVNSDFRYLLRRAEGTAGYEFLAEDDQTGERRDYVYFNHLGLVNRRLEADLRYAEASDDTYFEDLGGKIDLSSITHLDRSARLTYHAPAAYTIQAMLQSYQTIARNLELVDEPYQRLPYVRLDALTKNSVARTRLGIVGEYSNFQRDDSVQGQRLGLRPFLRMQRDDVAWFFNTQLDYSYTGYQLENTAPGQAGDPERALPVYSAEAGLRFERISGNGDLQIMEPRLFYLYAPFEAQDDLPLFDSGEPDFDFTQLFARNRFSGEDRISDANHMAAAITARQLDPTSGLTRVSASIGQLFRFEAPNVQLPGTTAPDSGGTDFIGALNFRLSQRWGMGFSSQWSPDEMTFNRNSVTLRLRDERRRLDLAYRYRRDLLEQADLQGSFPLYGGWRLAGRWRYSLLENQTLDAVTGVEYETCCWAIRSSFRRYIAGADGRYNSGIYLQLELKGLARIGSGFPGLLPSEQEAY